MDGSAIKELVELAVAANTGVAIGYNDNALALPDNMVIHDIEKYAETPARFRGTFTTNAIDHFVKYASKYYDLDSSALYLDTDAMSALAVFDLGSPDSPLHGDCRAIIKSESTLEFQVVQNAVSNWKPQEAAIDWLEDWLPNLSTQSDASMMSVIHALRSIRVTADNAKENIVSEFFTSKSALEKIEAKSTVGDIPNTLFFTCVPYSFSDQPRVFPLRVKIKTTKDGVSIAFSCTVLAQIFEQIRQEFEAELTQKLKDAGVDIQIYVGSFKFGKP